jgi:uncharacterized protein YjbI with pentapeptide repeats
MILDTNKIQNECRYSDDWQIFHNLTIEGDFSEKIIKRVIFSDCSATSNLILAKSKFAGCLFDCMKANGIDAQCATFIGCDFSEATLININFQGSIFEGCNFFRTRLFSSNLRFCQIIGCNFYEADLRETILPEHIPKYMLENILK